MKKSRCTGTFAKASPFALLGSLAVFASCSSAVGDPMSVEGPTEPVASRQDPLYILSTRVWTVPTIPVCWEFSGSDTEKGWVRDQIERTWGTETSASFSGWGTCTGTSQGIRIAVSDGADNPNTVGLGTQIDGVVNGMTLKFNFQNWSTACVSTRESCIRTIAAHEFGHALGFAHENNRADGRPASCTQVQGISGDTTFGAWDGSSIMNYCNPNWNNGGQLSPTDIAGASHYYGGPHSIAALPFNSTDEIIFYRGTDSQLYAQETFAGGGSILWHLGGSIASDPAVASWGPNRFDVFARGMNGTMLHIAYNGSWSAWDSLGGAFVGSPSVVARASGFLDVFARGTDNALHSRTFHGTSWNPGWATIGGNITGTPSAVTFGNSGEAPIDVFARSADGTLFHTSSASGWKTESLGGQIYGSPSAAYYGWGQMAVYVRGNDQGLWGGLYDGPNVWHGFQGPLATSISGSPSTIWDGTEEVVAYRDSTQSLSFFAWSPNNFAGNFSLPGQFLGSPTVTRTGNQLGFFVRGLNSALWRLRGTVGVSPSQWPSWVSFGGIIR